MSLPILDGTDFYATPLTEITLVKPQVLTQLFNFFTCHSSALYII